MCKCIELFLIAFPSEQWARHLLVVRVLLKLVRVELVLLLPELVGEAPLGSALVHVEHLVELLVLLVLLELEGGFVEYLVKLLVFLELLYFLSFPMAMSSSILEGFT